MTESTLLVPTMQTFVQFLTLGYFGFQALPEPLRVKVATHDSGKFSAPRVFDPRGRIVPFPAKHA